MQPHATPSPHRHGRFGWLSVVAILAGAAVLAWLILRSFAAQDHGAEVHAEVVAPPYWGIGVLPFAALLGAIAVLPLIHLTHLWWESNRNRLIVSMTLAACTVIYYVFAEGVARVPDVLQHAIVEEYIPFIVLLFSLYVISGGINLRSNFKPRPITNTIFLGVGAVMASFVGTTGASMLLIRPLLQTNSSRTHVTHTVVFFIFLVSNVGGCLLPIGDPPLFLGYLKGVEFLWTLSLWREWGFMVVTLLVLYFIWDTVVYAREAGRPVPALSQQPSLLRPPPTFRLSGTLNFIWLLGVVLAVALLDHQKALPGTDWHPFKFLRELVMLGFVALSLTTTPRTVREENRFNYTAILEVAALFIGIFITMQVPIQVLNDMGAHLGLQHPWQFFWTTGVLSSFLDNAPTYVVFFETANAMTQAPGEGIITLLSDHFIRQDLLVAISLGAVFMGANTYIGNGPNFMVKSIAEQSGIRMPGFFGYMFRFSVPVLVPLFVLVMILFLL